MEKENIKNIERELCDDASKPKLTNEPLKENELISPLSQLLKEFSKVDGELKFSTKELQNQFSNIQLSLQEWYEIQVSQNNILEKNLTILARETAMLTILPEKIETRLNQLVPNIAIEVQKSAFQFMETAIQNLHKSADSLDEKIQLSAKKIAEINFNSFKQKLMSLALVLSVTIFCSTGLTYLIMQRFPKIVTIDAKGDVKIDSGNVVIWDMGKKAVQSGKKRLSND
jgi:hypothetical protein